MSTRPATPSGAPSSTTAELRAQHAEALFFAKVLDDCVSAEDLASAVDAIQSLKVSLSMHFAAEAAEIVPVLIRRALHSPDKTLAVAAIRSFVTRLDWTRASFQAFLVRHSEGRRGLPTLTQEWRAFAVLIRELMELEEQRVYPIFDSLVTP